jgi:hypothetical protein
MSAFQLRLPDHVMEEAKAAAAEDNTSVNQMLLAIIAEGLGHRRGLKMMKERAGRADVAAALSILSRAPNVPPDEGDRLAESGKRRRRL